MGDFNYDTIDFGYYDRIFQDARGIQSKWHHTKFDRVRELMPLGRHLDIGCGPGTFIGTLGGNIQSIGVDIASGQIEYATQRYGSARRRFEVIEPGHLPFDDDSFDVATCIELLEHLPEDEGIGLFREIRRVLKPEAFVIATTPDYGGPWPILEWLLNRFGEISYEEQHITHFTRHRLLSFLGRAGFSKQECTRYQLFAPFTAALGWRLADAFARIEPGGLTSRLGFLLLARAVK